MQKNTKEQADITKKTASAKSSSRAKNTKKNIIKKDTTAKTGKAKKSTTTNTSKRNASKKTTTKSTKNTRAKKSVSKASKKSTSSSSKTVKTKKALTKSNEIIEYYDLPYRYNETIVKILAQTPNTLFVYWDISDTDREKFIKEFGNNFFESTIPVLIVHNKTMNYSFQIEINDFANSWYFNINDPKCDYEIELGRIAKPYEINLPNNFMHIASSNVIETPNNHILFEKNHKVLFFRNAKNNNRFSKDISHLDFMHYIGKSYSIYNIYKKMYKDEELQNLENNPSSNY